MTAIEWTDAVWNPVTGCDRVSPGCAHCYALELAPKLRRFALARARQHPERPRGKWADVLDGGPASGPAFGVTLHPDVLEQPLRWRRPRRVFVNSMSDLFHDDVPDMFIQRVWDVMAQAGRALVYPGLAHEPVHTFQVLTKRPERMRDWVTGWLERKLDYAHRCETNERVEMRTSPAALEARRCAAPLPNVWLGVSIENRRYVDRADLLRATPAAVRFISAEPLLGPLVFDSDMGMARDRDWPGADLDEYAGVPEHLRGDPYEPCWLDGGDLPELDLEGIDWLIVGGESGPAARPIREEWARDLRDACHAQGLGHLRPDPGGRTAFFMKQMGGLPADLRIREFGRVYTWRGTTWRVLVRWSGNAPRNVLLERVEPCLAHDDAPLAWCCRGTGWHATGERVVRPFRGLRRLEAASS